MIFSAGDDAPIALDELPAWRGAAGGPARLELEIGSGHGGYALAFARRHPERSLVAIEQRKKFAEELRARADRHGHRNLLVVQGDARILAPRLFRARSLAAIHVHFPDPWWKRRHHHRRLVDDGMSRLLHGLLAPAGLLDLRTDVEAYAVEALERLEAVGFWNEAGEGGFWRGAPEEIPSSREKRYLVSGKPVWRLRLRREPPRAARRADPLDSRDGTAPP